MLDVLQDLVGMDDVERGVSERQRLGVGLVEFDVVDAAFGARRPGFVEDVGGGVDGDDSAGCHEAGEIASDGARTATDIEQFEARSKAGQEVGGGVRSRPRPMRPQDAVVMPVRVQGGAS